MKKSTTRKMEYLLMIFGFFWWLKKKDTVKFNDLNSQFSTLELPIGVILDLIDSLLYYKSPSKAIQVLIKYQQEKIEREFNNKVKELVRLTQRFNTH